jgi:hypothetical protein
VGRAAVRVAGYRFLKTFGGRWGSSCALVLSIGRVGGPVLAARTSTALLRRAE